MFGQLSWRLTEKLRLSAGLRYSKDKRRIDYDVLLLDIPAPATGIELIANRPGLGAAFISDAQSGDWSDVTPKLGLEYFADDEVMYFISLTEGFKSGGYNGILFGAATALEAVDPEQLLSYEAGLKSTLRGGRMRLNATAFFYDYSDIQLNILTAEQSATRGFANVRNAGDADIMGAEIELNFQVTEKLRIDALAAYLDTELKSLRSTDPNNATSVDQTGNPLPNAPQASFSLGGEYRWSIGSGALTLRLDYSARSRRYHSIYRDLLNSSASNRLLNTRLSYTPNNGDWSVAAFARNLSDEDNESFGFRAGFFGALKVYGEGRSYGVNARYRF